MLCPFTRHAFTANALPHVVPIPTARAPAPAVDGVVCDTSPTSAARNSILNAPGVSP